MMLFLLLQSPKAIGHPILGYIIPAAIFIFSFWVAYSLYRSFAKKTK